MKWSAPCWPPVSCRHAPRAPKTPAKPASRYPTTATIGFAHAVPSLYVYGHLHPFADQNADGWRITPASVRRARDAGLDAVGIIASLDTLALGGVPPELQARIKAWSKHFGDATAQNAHPGPVPRSGRAERAARRSHPGQVSEAVQAGSAVGAGGGQAGRSRGGAGVAGRARGGVDAGALMKGDVGGAELRTSWRQAFTTKTPRHEVAQSFCHLCGLSDFGAFVVRDPLPSYAPRLQLDHVAFRVGHIAPGHPCAGLERDRHDLPDGLPPAARTISRAATTSSTLNARCPKPGRLTAVGGRSAIWS